MSFSQKILYLSLMLLIRFLSGIENKAAIEMIHRNAFSDFLHDASVNHFFVI